MSKDDDMEATAIEILRTIRRKIDDIGDPKYTVPDLGNSNEEPEGKLTCTACRSPIKPAEICITMPCCGCWCHALCIGKIANAHRFIMEKACPLCRSEFDHEFQERILQIWDVLKKKQG